MRKWIWKTFAVFKMLKEWKEDDITETGGGKNVLLRPPLRSHVQISDFTTDH